MGQIDASNSNDGRANPDELKLLSLPSSVMSRREKPALRARRMRGASWREDGHDAGSADSISKRRRRPGCRCNRSPIARSARSAPSPRCRPRRQCLRRSGRRQWRRRRCRRKPPIRSARQCLRRSRRLQACLFAAVAASGEATDTGSRAGQSQRESENFPHVSPRGFNRTDIRQMTSLSRLKLRS